MSKFFIQALLGTTLLIAGCSPTEVKSEPVAVQQGVKSLTPYPAALFHQSTTFRISGAGGHAFSADGENILVSSDHTGIFNSYALSKTGELTPLTTSQNYPLYARSYFPKDNRIIVQGDQGGNELDHVFVRLEDGTLKDLTPGEKTKANFIGFSDDGKTIYITTNERDPGSDDLFAYDSETYARTRVFENNEMYIGALSSDGRYLSLDKRNSSSDGDIFVADLMAEDGAKIITAHEGNVSFRSYDFTPDGTRLIYGTDETSEFSQAWSYNLKTDEKKPYIKADWDIQFVGFSPSGKYRYAGVNEDALTQLTIINMQTGEELKLEDLPNGELGQVRFNQDETQLVLAVNTDQSPANVYHVDLISGETQKLTEALPSEINPDSLVDGKVVRYKSFDGLDIPAILYMPKDASTDSPVPALVWVHGGPGGQSTKGYSAMFQHLVNNGYAVLAANNRGSSGYGKTFFHLDDRQHGEADLKDIVAARDYLESLPGIDNDKIGVSGASYGGFMTVAALAFYPEVFDVGVNIFGVTNWDRTLKSIPPFWGAFRTALYDEMGDPATDTERHRRISPLFSADKIVKPLYVMQGANDPRVLQIESDEMVAAVRANGTPVDYVLFDDEGHGIQKRKNRIENSERIVKFLDTHLKGDDQN